MAKSNHNEGVVELLEKFAPTLKLLTGNRNDDGATSEKKMEMKIGSVSGFVRREKEGNGQGKHVRCRWWLEAFFFSLSVQNK